VCIIGPLQKLRCDKETGHKMVSICRNKKSCMWFSERQIFKNEYISPISPFVLVLVQIDLIQFENSNCIRSFCTKTNTNSLHTNSLHSISRKIGHVIQIVVHQFVNKTSAKKNQVCKNRSPYIPRYVGICRISTKEKKIIPYKP
jgi:hypothetical protein